MDNWAAWHQRSSWAQTPGTGTVFRLSCCFSGQHWKTLISADKHLCFLSNLAVFSVFVRVCDALFCGAASFYRLSTLSADRYVAKIMLGCHVSFERNFQNGVKISLTTGYRYTTPPGF